VIQKLDKLSILRLSQLSKGKEFLQRYGMLLSLHPFNEMVVFQIKSGFLKTCATGKCCGA